MYSDDILQCCLFISSNLFFILITIQTKTTIISKYSHYMHKKTTKLTSTCPCLLLRNLKVLRDWAICLCNLCLPPLRTLSWLPETPLAASWPEGTVALPSPGLVGVDRLLSSPAIKVIITVGVHLLHYSRCVQKQGDNSGNSCLSIKK